MLNLNFQNGQAPALNARNMNAIVESINTLGYAVGGPNVASTVSEMTDTEKVYVYTGSETGYTAGNWYYYNGSAWVSGGVYQAAAVETDTTLTIPGEPADAKATGDEVADLKNDLDTINLSICNADKYYPSNWTIPGGIHPDTGVNGGTFAAGKARTGNISLADRAPLAVRFDTAKYAALVWGYDAEGTAVKCYTNNDFSGRHVLIPKDDAVTRIRLCLKRTDNQAMTTDADDPTSDVNVIPATTFLQYLTDRTLSLDGALADAKATGDAIAAAADPLRSTAAVNRAAIDTDRYFEVGGTFVPYLEQGRLNFNPGVLQPVADAKIVRCSVDKPPMLRKGSTIHTGALYALVTRTHRTAEGYIRGAYVVGAWTQGDISIPADGLYTMIYCNAAETEDATELTPEEAALEVTITCPAPRADRVSQDFALPGNPYAHIAKKKDSETGAVTWSDRVHDIISTCHLHTPHAYNFRRAVNKGYEHLAISNYHAAKPTVPIREVLPLLPDYNYDLDVVPDGWLESPNAEHAYFTDAAKYVGSSSVATHLHLNSVGSYASSGIDNTGASEGGYDGTVSEFMDEAARMLKYPNGGGVTINHPKWSGITADGIKSIMGAGPVFAMEIFNGSAEAQNGKGYSLDIWDGVLSDGIQIYGVAVPDHASEGAFDWQNIPWGYNHMLCIEKTEQDIMLAYRNGQFYSTIYNDDLRLTYFGLSDGTVTIRASKAGTIIFTTATRTVTVENASVSTFDIQENDTYVRAEIQADNNRLFTNAIIL